MKINAKERHTEYVRDEDGNFRCTHLEAKVIPPCCTTPDQDTGRISCGCQGDYSIYCDECKNEDLTDYETDELIIYQQIVEDYKRRKKLARIGYNPSMM